MKQILLLIIAGVVVAGCSTGYTVTLKETGSNVVATGSGAINLTGLSFLDTAGEFTPVIVANIGCNSLGATPAFISIYNGFSGPMSFGSGGYFAADTGSGNPVGICVKPHLQPQQIWVPQGYVSGAALSGSATWNNATLDSLGVTPGIYVWTWGTGANYQNFTLIIGPYKWWRWLTPLYWRFPFPEWRSWPPPWPPPRDLPRPKSGDRVLAK